jgi:hypothetical protein
MPRDFGRPSIRNPRVSPSGGILCPTEKGCLVVTLKSYLAHSDFLVSLADDGQFLQSPVCSSVFGNRMGSFSIIFHPTAKILGRSSDALRAQGLAEMELEELRIRLRNSGGWGREGKT